MQRRWWDSDGRPLESDHAAMWDRIALGLRPDRLPGDPIPELEVLTDIERRRTGELRVLRPEPLAWSRFTGRWSDEDAFFDVHLTTTGWAVVLVKDVHSTMGQRIDPIREFDRFRTACGHAADLNWLIGRVPSGEWRSRRRRK